MTTHRHLTSRWGISFVGSLVLEALLALLALPSRSHAQAGAVDLNFNPMLGANSQVYAVALQTNGQILIGGAFTNVGAMKRTNVARLNPDGTVDAAFNAGPTAANAGYVNAIAVQSDGKVLIGGEFSSVTNATPNFLARLNSNGTVDSGFDPFLMVDGVVNAVVVQTDGKIVFGGGFTIVDGLTRRSVARLLTNGTLDTGFDACVAAGSGNGATALALRDDGKIWMSGIFSFTSGNTRTGVALLGTNGDLDVTYAPEPGMNTNTVAYTLTHRTNGSILLGGNFSTYHAMARHGLVQLTPAGDVDAGFNPGTGIDFGQVYALAVQPDGKVIAAGDFSKYNDVVRFGIARINTDGSLDPSFDPHIGVYYPIGSISIQSDRRIQVGGRFSSFDSVSRNGLVRVMGDSEPFRFTLAGWSGAGQFQMMFSAGTQAQYRIERSSNLSNWTSLTNVTADSNAIPVVDPETNSLPQQFYRALLLP